VPNDPIQCRSRLIAHELNEAIADSIEKKPMDLKGTSDGVLSPKGWWRWKADDWQAVEVSGGQYMQILMWDLVTTYGNLSFGYDIGRAIVRLHKSADLTITLLWSDYSMMGRSVAELYYHIKTHGIPK
jgi:hypothetical protein